MEACGNDLPTCISGCLVRAHSPPHFPPIHCILHLAFHPVSPLPSRQSARACPPCLSRKSTLPDPRVSLLFRPVKHCLARLLLLALPTPPSFPPPPTSLPTPPSLPPCLLPQPPSRATLVTLGSSFLLRLLPASSRGGTWTGVTRGISRRSLPCSSATRRHAATPTTIWCAARECATDRRE